jgi:hypothetical protein
MSICSFVIVLAGGAMGAGPPGASIMFVVCVGGILLLAALVYGIMYLVMLARFGRSFREQATFAKTIWSQQKT